MIISTPRQKFQTQILISNFAEREYFLLELRNYFPYGTNFDLPGFGDSRIFL